MFKDILIVQQMVELIDKIIAYTVQADGHDHPGPEKNDHPCKLNVSWLNGSA